MNSLSWMIYLADVASYAGKAAAVIAFFGAIGAACGSVIAVAAYADKEADVAMNARRWSAGAFKITIVCAVMAALLPSKTTVYAIAASEMGEKVIASPTAGKAMKALDAWLDRQIGEDKAEEAK